MVVAVPGRVCRSAFLYRLEQQPFTSEMVFTNLDRICARSVFSLLSFERRQLARIAGLSGADGALLHLASAGPFMDCGLLIAGVANWTTCGTTVAIERD